MHPVWRVAPQSHAPGTLPGRALPFVHVAGLGAVGKKLERETGIEPATNSLEGCDSTTELLPLVARGGFEPPKPLGRQIYSLLRLTAPQPRRLSCPPAVATVTRAPSGARAGRLADRRRTLPQQIVLWNSS